MNVTNLIVLIFFVFCSAEKGKFPPKNIVNEKDSLSYTFSPTYSNSSSPIDELWPLNSFSSSFHGSLSSLSDKILSDRLTISSNSLSSKTMPISSKHIFSISPSKRRQKSRLLPSLLYPENHHHSSVEFVHHPSVEFIPSSSGGVAVNHQNRQLSHFFSPTNDNPSRFHSSGESGFQITIARDKPRNASSSMFFHKPTTPRMTSTPKNQFRPDFPFASKKKTLRHAKLEEAQPSVVNMEDKLLGSNYSTFFPKNGTKTSKLSPPTNVVKEVPTLDVGPLTVVTVSKGDTARLPCQYQSSIQDDTVRLVLWYRNETSRPLLSYDARDRSGDLSFIEYEAARKSKSDQLRKRSTNRATLKGGRIYLAKGGSVLIVKETRNSDQAEYRCTVHYKKLPAVTFRLQLVITEIVKKVELFDSAGQKIGEEIGPLSEGSKLSLTCKTHYTGKLIDLKWLVEGEATTASRVHVGKDTAEIDMSMVVERRHAHATVTCRLVCSHTQSKGGVTANIVDASTTILLFYVPQATLLLDEATSNGIKILPEGVQGGGHVEIKENQRIKFTCAVRARPPPYNITWLLNGRVLSSGVRRRVIGDSFLEIFPVERSDSGVYACLASNTEGDGHSNAIMVTVNHAPYCVGPLNRQVIVVRNTTVTLSCTVESHPAKVTFTWRVNHNQGKKTSTSSTEDAMRDKDGGVVTGDHRFMYVPKLIDLNPESNNVTGSSSTYSQQERSIYMAYGPSLPHAVDPDEPTRSLLKLTPGEESMGIVCFAKNFIGRMRVPCSYNIIVIDPLMPLQLCSVVKTESTTLEVACSEYPQGTEPVKQLVPGPSYVRSPDARTVSTMEVWSKKTLLANVTGNHPRWVVQGLPSDTNLRLTLYNVSPHTHSEPVVLYARTKPRTLATTQEIINEETSEHHHVLGTSSSVDEPEDGRDEIAWILGIAAGVAGLLLVIASIVGVIVLRTNRSRETSASEEEPELPEMAETEVARSESPWESPALLIKPGRLGDNSEFIEEMQSPIGEDCKLIESEEMQEVLLPSRSVTERGIT